MNAPLVPWVNVPPALREYIDRHRRALAVAWGVCWRQLVLLVRAKLEMIALGLSTVEREFLADLMLPGGVTLHEHLRPAIDEVYESGQLPPLLGGHVAG